MHHENVVHHEAEVENVVRHEFPEFEVEDVVHLNFLSLSLRLRM